MKLNAAKDLLDLYKNESTIKSVQFIYSKSKVGLITPVIMNLEVPGSDKFSYEKVTIRSYPLYLFVNTTSTRKENNVHLTIGCINNITVEVINCIISELEGEKMTEVKKCIFDKKVPITGRSRVELLEETDNYYISNLMKAYPKATFEIRDTDVNMSVVKFIKDKYLSYKGHNVDISGSRKEELLKTLYYIKTVMDYIEITYYS